MKEFKGKVAVITGAASGIGYAIAERCAQMRMNVVLADIEESALTQAEQKLRAAGAPIMAVQTDVSKANDIYQLAQKTLNTFGAVHLLVNNAGVSAGTTVWGSTLADWEWTIGVNLWGVIHGIREFVPIMLRQDTECHIVNTASIAGLISGPGMGIYKVTKHGVVSLSETLYCELAEAASKIKVSVLCPGWVNTRIMNSERNRPVGLENELGGELKISEDELRRQKMVQHAVQTGLSPQHVAEDVFDAIKNEKFYIFTHPEMNVMVQQRIDNILQERPPQ